MSNVTVKVSEASNLALDWLVTSIETPDALRYGVQDWREQRRGTKNGEFQHRWTQNWNQGGPIIAMHIVLIEDLGDFEWEATAVGGTKARGDTVLQAVCRCYVASKLGDTVEAPEELV